MTNLGKFIILIYLFYITLMANVELQINTPAIFKGDIASFAITAKGENVCFPEILHIDSFKILNITSSSSIKIQKSTTIKSSSKTYVFMPTKDVKIPSFKLEIDGEIFSTKAASIDLITPCESCEGDDFIIETIIDKKSAFVGEFVKFSIIFKHKINAKFDDLKYDFDDVSGLSIKQISEPLKQTKCEYIVEKIDFAVVAQIPGEFKLLQVTALIGLLSELAQLRMIFLWIFW